MIYDFFYDFYLNCFDFIDILLLSCQLYKIFVYSMVLLLDGSMRTYGVNQAFRFVEGIWLHRKSRQIHFFTEKDLVFIIRAQREMSNHLI